MIWAAIGVIWVLSCAVVVRAFFGARRDDLSGTLRARGLEFAEVGFRQIVGGTERGTIPFPAELTTERLEALCQLVEAYGVEVEGFELPWGSELGVLDWRRRPEERGRAGDLIEPADFPLVDQRALRDAIASDGGPL